MKLLKALLLPALLLSACFGPDDKDPTVPPATNPPHITVQPRDTTVMSGQTLTFTVVAESALTYQWVRLPADTLPGATLAGLTITADTSLDSAAYLCVVRNLNGSVTTRTTVLRVTADTTYHPPLARNCATNPVIFTEYVIDPSVVKVLGQIGSIGGNNTEIVGRSYVFPKDGQTGQRLAVIAPTDLKLRGSKHYRPSGAPTTGYIPDWSLSLEADCGVSLEFYHIKDVSDSIKSVSDTVVYPASNWELVSHKVKIKAGDTIGWYIPAAPGGLAAFDFIVNNDSVTNQFANTARYVARSSNVLHVVCPYDLFTPTRKAVYYSLMGTVSGIPVGGAGCGTVQRDVPGTVAGQWFFDSAFTVGPGVLQKDGVYGDPMQIIVSPDSVIMIGHTGPTNDIRFQRDNPTWKRPDAITTEWCYQVYPTPSAPDGWLWLKMMRADKMNVAYSSTGTCPSTFPTTGFKSFFR